MLLLFVGLIQSNVKKFEAKLRKQQFESEIDSKWLQREETKRLSFIANSPTGNDTNEGSQNFEQNVTDNVDVLSLRHQQKEMKKTLSIDRTNDSVYDATTNVVKAIMSLSQGVEKAAAAEYLV